MEAQRGQASWRRGTYGGRTDQKAEPSMKAPVGELLRTITLSEVQLSLQFQDVVPIIEDCEYVSSYNWLNQKQQTILVPGRFMNHI